MSTVVQARLPVLSEDAQEHFDRYQVAKLAKAKADATSRRQDTTKKESQAAVTAEMGDALRAALPDGRVVQRLPKSMHRRAQPAKDVSWEELIDASEA